MATLEDLYGSISAGFVFNKHNYPNFPEGEEQRKIFSIEHVQKHIAKSLGGAAAIIEPFDHGTPLSEEAKIALQVLACKQIVNAIKLADIVGLPVVEIERYILEQYS